MVYLSESTQIYRWVNFDSSSRMRALGRSLLKPLLTFCVRTLNQYVAFQIVGNFTLILNWCSNSWLDSWSYKATCFTIIFAQWFCFFRQKQAKMTWYSNSSETHSNSCFYLNVLCCKIVNRQFQFLHGLSQMGQNYWSRNICQLFWIHMSKDYCEKCGSVFVLS